MIPSSLANRAISPNPIESYHTDDNDSFHDALTEQPPERNSIATIRPASLQTLQTTGDTSATQFKHRSVHVTVRQQGVHDVGNISYHSRNEFELHHVLHEIFSKHLDENNESDLLELISSRARELHNMGETPESLDAFIKKGNTLDIMAQFTRGFIRSVPFAVASVTFDKIPALRSLANGPLELGLHAGLQASSIDTYGSLLLDRATANTTWFSAEPEKLAPVMKDIAKYRKPSDLQTGINTGIGFEAYSLRNLVRLFLVPLTDYASNPRVAAEFDTWLTGGGGAAAGGLSSLFVNYRNHRNGSMGPEYLLGRTDWQEQYQAVKDVHMVKDPLKGAALRALKFPVDIVTDTPRALRGVFAAPNIGKSAVVGGGFAVIIKLRDMASQAMKSGLYNSASVTAMSHFVNVVTCIPVFGAVPPTEAISPAVSKVITKGLQEKLPELVSSSAEWFGKQAKTLISHAKNRPLGRESEVIELVSMSRQEDNPPQAEASTSAHFQQP